MIEVFKIILGYATLLAAVVTIVTAYVFLVRASIYTFRWVDTHLGLCLIFLDVFVLLAVIDLGIFLYSNTCLLNPSLWRW